MIPARADNGYWHGTGLVLLWTSFLAGPAAWAVNQGVGYALMKPVCAGAIPYVLWAIAAASFALAGAGGWIGWRCLRMLRATAAEDGGRVPDRSFFLAIIAIALNGLIALLVVTSLIPQFLLSPCE